MTRLILAVLATALLTTTQADATFRQKCKPSTSSHTRFTCTSDFTTPMPRS